MPGAWRHGRRGRTHRACRPSSHGADAMAARVWSVTMAPKAAPVLAVMLLGIGVVVGAPAGRAPSVRLLAAPDLAAAERPPVLGRLQVSAPLSRARFTKWCAGPSGVRIVTPCTATDSGYAGEPGSYSFTVLNPTANDVGYHAVVSCSG